MKRTNDSTMKRALAIIATGMALTRLAVAADAVKVPDFFTFEPRPVVTGAFFRPADGGNCHAADLKACEAETDGGAVRLTYVWGDVETTYGRVSPNRIDIVARIRVNEGLDDMHGLYIELGKITFAREPETFNRSFLFYCESPIAHNQGAPAVVDVRDGVRGLAVRSDDLRHEIGVGLVGAGKERTLLALTGRHPETKAMNYPWIERPIRAGSSDIWRFSLVWGDKVESLPELSRDLYEAYAKLHPFTLKWNDRRPIARVFCASSPYSGFPPATNPRGWFNDRDVVTTTPEGLVQFSNRVDVVARQTVSVMKKYGAQGCIVWDIEGQQYWHPTSYLGDPRSIPAEMEPHADRFFRMITNEGFRVGVCIRPQRPVRGAYDGKVEQMQFLSRDERFRNMCAKIDCARRRWGCTLFYVDSDIEFVPDGIVIPGAWGVSAFKDSQIMRDLAVKYPDSLFIPEWQDLRTYANCAPYSNMKFDRIFDPGEIVRIAYPGAFLVNVANDLDLSGGELRAGFVKSIREGNIVCIDGWFDNAVLNDPVRSWYDEARSGAEADIR